MCKKDRIQKKQSTSPRYPQKICTKQVDPSSTNLTMLLEPWNKNLN